MQKTYLEVLGKHSKAGRAARPENGCQSQVVYLSPEWADVTIAFEWTARATLTDGRSCPSWAGPRFGSWEAGGGGAGRKAPPSGAPLKSALLHPPSPCLVLLLPLPSLAWMSVLLPALCHQLLPTPRDVPAQLLCLDLHWHFPAS